MTATRLVAYAPNGASLGLLPTPLDLQASFPLDDVGALTFSYALDAPRSTLLGSPVEVAVEVSGDGGQTWTEPESGRFLYWRDSGDPVRRNSWSVECPAYVQRLAKAVVPFTGLNADGNREFVTQTPGFILHTLFTEAQARGAMSGMAWDFTAAADSAGVAWGRTVNIAYDPGKDFLSILREFADLGWVDFRTQGRTLQVYAIPESWATAGPQAGNPMSEDKTVGANPVALRFGRDLTEAPFRRTWEGLADTVLVGGDNLATHTMTAPGALKPWGRQESYVSAAGVDDPGTLNVIAFGALLTSDDVRAEYTYGLAFAPNSPLPFRDYGVGDWVFRTADGAEPVRMRVRQITLTRDTSGETSGNVVLNDRFLEGDVLLQRRIQAITGAASNGGTSGTPSNNPVGNDILAPAQVVGVTGTSAAYVQTDGTVAAQVSLDWPDVTTNADGTAATDVAKYQVDRRLTSGTTDADFARVDEVTASRSYQSPLTPETSYTFRVRAVDSVGNEGAWSANYVVLTARDNNAPAVPAAPTVTSTLGVAKVAWTGLAASGSAMDDDFAWTEVHASTASGFTPTAATLKDYLSGQGEGLVTGFVRGTTIYVRLVAVDTSGNKSAASAQASHVVVGATGPDMEANSVTANAIKAGDVDTIHLKATAIDAMTITLAAGGKLRTTSTPSRGVQFDANGIQAWNSSGVRTFWLDPATGNGEFLGTIKSGSTITGVTITGTTTITSPTINGATLTGGTMDLGSGKFTVSSVGDVTASGNLTIQGWLTCPGNKAGFSRGIIVDGFGGDPSVYASHGIQIATKGPLTHALYVAADGARILGGYDLNGGGSLSGTVTVTSLSGTGQRYVVTGASGVISAGAATSDERLKANLESLDDLAAVAITVEPFSFDWKDGSGRAVGFMANRVGDLGAVMDLFIARDEDGRGIGVDYPMWVVAQQAILRKHEARIQALENAA